MGGEVKQRQDSRWRFPTYCVRPHGGPHFCCSKIVSTEADRPLVRHVPLPQGKHLPPAEHPMTVWLLRDAVVTIWAVGQSGSIELGC